MKKFYVYLLLRPDGTPFYAGKGSGKRMYKHAIHAHWHPRRPCEFVILEIEAAGGEVGYIKVFETDDEREAYAEEKRVIDQIGRENLCNIYRGGTGSFCGRITTNEWRAMMSERMKGRIFKEETRHRISKAGKGRTISAEQRAKIAATLKGRSGPRRSDETREKIRQLKLAFWEKRRAEGNMDILGPEIRARIAEKLRGRPQSAEMRRKLSEAKRGKPKSAEARKRLSESKRAKSVLDADKVRRMRQQRAEGAKLTELAEEYGINFSYVGQICRRRAWSDVE